MLSMTLKQYIRFLSPALDEIQSKQTLPGEDTFCSKRIDDYAVEAAIFDGGTSKNSSLFEANILTSYNRKKVIISYSHKNIWT